MVISRLFWFLFYTRIFHSITGGQHFLDHVEDVKAHVGTYQGDRFEGQSAVGTKPPKDSGKPEELPDNHGMGNGIIGKSIDPAGLGKPELGSKVGPDHAQLHRGEDGNGKSHQCQSDSGHIAGQIDEGQDAFRQMQECQ